jgi:hypothetical protein
MQPKQLIKEFKQLAPATQVALIAFALALIVLLVVFPAAGTSIITFLVALRCFLLDSNNV